MRRASGASCYPAEEECQSFSPNSIHHSACSERPDAAVGLAAAFESVEKHADRERAVMDGLQQQHCWYGVRPTQVQAARWTAEQRQTLLVACARG